MNSIKVLQLALLNLFNYLAVVYSRRLGDVTSGSPGTRNGRNPGYRYADLECP